MTFTRVTIRFTFSVVPVLNLSAREMMTGHLHGCQLMRTCGPGLRATGLADIACPTAEQQQHQPLTERPAIFTYAG